MSFVLSKRGARAIAAVLITAGVLDATASLASAALPLRLSQLKQLRIPHLPRPPLTLPEGFAESLRYGVPDEDLVAALDTIGSSLKSDVDDTATRVGAAADDVARIKQCAGRGLKGAGESYRSAVVDAYNAGLPAPAPNFETVSAGAQSCLEETYPDVPQAVFDLSTELANLAANRAREASDEAQAGAVVAEWMVLTGDELETDTVSSPPSAPPPIAPDPPDPDTDSGTPWGYIGAGAFVVLLLIGGAALSSSSKPRG
jgi:hypothetical protein